VQDLKAEQLNINFFQFKRKTEIQQDLDTLKERQEILENDFKKRYNINIEKADLLISQLKKELRQPQANERKAIHIPSKLHPEILTKKHNFLP